MNLFYLVCPIGLESALTDELRLKAPFLGPAQIRTGQGGVEINCGLEEGLELNYRLKTPTRILMRVKTRRCRDFPKLFKVVSSINWREYLIKEEVDWRISSSKSRIINTSKAQSACEQALTKYFQGSPLSKKTRERGANSAAQKVYLRFDNDDLTISLDTSGELLHIRGSNPDRGKASLRETYAACLLTILRRHWPRSEAWSALIDPMCGTGAFLNEALDFCRPNSRQFPFLNWKEAASVRAPGKELSPLCERAIGIDLEPSAKSRENLEVLQGDFFKLEPPPSLPAKGNFALVCNPPYGKRVKIQGSPELFFKRLIERVEKVYQPAVYGIIIPEEIKVAGVFDHVYAFNNNGIKVKFCVRILRPT